MMIIQTEGLQDKLFKLLSQQDKKIIKDFTYAITFEDYMANTGTIRLNFDKIVALHKTDPELAQILQIPTGTTEYAELDRVGALKLILGILNKFYPNLPAELTVKEVEHTCRDEISNDIADKYEETINSVLKKVGIKSETNTSFAVVNEMVRVFTGLNPIYSKYKNHILNRCLRHLNKNADEASQVLAVLDAITEPLFLAKNNNIEEALLKVRFYEAREKLGITAFPYTLHFSEDTYEAIKNKPHVKVILFNNFKVAKQTGKLTERDKNELLEVYKNFSTIAELLA